MTSPSTSAVPRIFVSHSHADNTFCRRLVADLRGAGADVWYDEHNLGWGELRREIDRELPARPYFVVILSPEAVDSDWVNREIDGALDLLRDGSVRVFLPVVARPCTIPATLRGFRRVDYTAGEDAAGAALFHALGLRLPSPTQSPPSETPLPPEHFPQRLRDLGFLARTIGGVEVIVPPLCDVPAGEFLMGSDPKRDSQAQSGEQPQHRLTLPAFQIARYPVTVAEYACFVRAGGKEPQRGSYGPISWHGQLKRLDHPAVCVSWRDAMAYAAWLARVTGQPWRLPTEAEWEKAARGSDGRIYPWGDAFDQARCNTSESGIKATTPVGTYPQGASPCGAQDMAGNVWEWTSSVYKSYPYNRGDGRERVDSLESRVLRGGSWLLIAIAAGAACRGDDQPDYFDDGLGFRVVCVVPGS